MRAVVRPAIGAYFSQQGSPIYAGAAGAPGADEDTKYIVIGVVSILGAVAIHFLVEADQKRRPVRK